MSWNFWMDAYSRMHRFQASVPRKGIRCELTNRLYFCHTQLAQVARCCRDACEASPRFSFLCRPFKLWQDLGFLQSPDQDLEYHICGASPSSRCQDQDRGRQNSALRRCSGIPPRSENPAARSRHIDPWGLQDRQPCLSPDGTPGNRCS